MKCSYAEHLRDVALVSISRELRTRTERRSLPASVGERRTRDAEALLILQKKTNEDRKAVRNHIANCRQCQNVDQGVALSPSSFRQSLRRR